MPFLYFLLGLVFVPPCPRQSEVKQPRAQDTGHPLEHSFWGKGGGRAAVGNSLEGRDGVIGSVRTMMREGGRGESWNR